MRPKKLDAEVKFAVSSVLFFFKSKKISFSLEGDFFDETAKLFFENSSYLKYMKTYFGTFS
jgi:hypothetical protein